MSSKYIIITNNETPIFVIFLTQSAPALLPNISCSNVTKLLVLEKLQPLPVHISTFSCYMQKFSELITELSQELKEITQVMQDMELLMTGTTVPKNCSLPAFEQELDTFIHAKCFLQLVQKRLTNPKF